MYQINEIFTSIQGEGVHAGRPATFIRLQGCTVGCAFCDTKYTWKKGGTPMEVREIMAQVKTTHVVITGGEPTAQDLTDLILALNASGHFTQLETSGQNDLPGAILPQWITWSPKVRLGFKAAKTIMLLADEVKWVVDDTLELTQVMETWNDFSSVYSDYTVARLDWPHFVFMPEGVPPKDEFVKKAIDFAMSGPINAQLNWRYGDRLHTRLGVR